jgi:hypothetical protein
MVAAGRFVTTKTGAWKVGSSPHGADAEVSHATTDDQRPDAAEVIGLELLGLGRGTAPEAPTRAAARPRAHHANTIRLCKGLWLISR